MSFPNAKVKAKRESLGLTRKQLADRCELTDRHIEALEQGRKPNPTMETIAALCKGLGVDCGFFFAEADDTPAEEPKRGRPRKTPETEAEPAKKKPKK